MFRKIAAVFLALMCAPGASGAEPVDFSRDVRPILSGTCFKCHGVDDKARKASLRLDVREAALKEADSGERAIVPGKPEASELIRRIFSDDEDELMPPPATKLKLTAAQKETLKRWIAEGAEYKPHWAFLAPVKAPLPELNAGDASNHPIDRFVRARLEREGLTPSAESDRYTLVRRVYLDLIGLPPTIEEADAFVNDRAPDAYERLVDRLLASPQYGERWARRWLDLARYADTNGYEKDRPRTIWPYRNWVIDALNADMPFDQFTIEQLAGDMLPNATPEQKIATGFHRNTMLNEEGGIDPLEFRFHAMTDRVGTTATAWLGLTVACAQCHTHKYDPITHHEYYGLMALLNNADEPTLELPEKSAGERKAQIDAEVAKLEATLPIRAMFPTSLWKPPAIGRFAAWEKAAAAKAVKWTVVRPVKMTSSMPALTQLDDGSILGSGDITKSDTYELTFRDVKGAITAIRIEAIPDERLPNRGPGMIYYEGPIGDFSLSELTLASDGKPAKFAKAAHSFAAGGNTAATAIDGNPQTGWMVNGGQGKPHAAVFALATPASGDELTVKMLFERHYAPALGRFRISVTNDPRAAEPSAALPPAVEEALATPAVERTAGHREHVLRHFLSTAPQLAAARKQIDQIRNSMPKPQTTLVMSERPAGHERPTFLHHRGEFLQPKEQVSGGVPAILPPLPKEAAANRLTFARWLVSRENPLTARVVVNRHWAAIFGRGLVRTTEDFGFQGELPSHPELLDWLAIEFMERGWSIKQLHRLIVTSGTYRQASTVTPQLVARDPENVLLGRGPRVRVDAEIVRDAALKASGLLSPKIGGPSVFPPQPASVTTEGAYGKLEWKASTGEDRYRRSLYTFMKRTAPFALYNAFDAPSGEACLARREVSNTPLQALSLLNDTVFMEAAQAMGTIAASAEGKSDEDRVTLLFRRVLTRPPATEEVGALAEFARTQRDRFKAKQLDPVKFAGAGKGDVIERATWTAVARAIMNFDEAVVKD